MKTSVSIAILFLCPTLILFGQPTQEIEIKSEISDVTVYLSGAQVTRSKTVDLPTGRTSLKFVDLSPFIDSKSVNINAKGEFTVLSVNFQQNFLTQQTRSKEYEDLMKTKEEIEKKIKIENAHLDVLNEEMAFLKANSSIGGANTGTSLTSLKEADAYFIEKITAIKLKQIDRQNSIEQLIKELEKTENQLAVLANKKEFPSGEIIVNVDSKLSIKATFELRYFVSNAGWTPSYDIRVKNIDLPAELIYKANVHQNTNENWKNIKLRLSSSDPNTSNNYRELQPYFLNYNTRPPSYYNNISQVSGHIYDSKTKEPIVGASIMIKGTSIGTVSDVNGAYSLSVPQNGGVLLVSFIGYKQQEAPVTSQQMDFMLEEDSVSLDEVVVMGYGVAEKSLQGRMAGVNLSKSKTTQTPEPAQQKSIIVETEQVPNQTSVEFDIKTPYTIPSDGKNLTIDIDNYSLPASYQYYCTPKIDKNAYIIAQIADWEQYNFLEGEANVFFEDTYTGKTLLDVRFMTDTLTISLGKDKGVTVKRDIQKQFTTRQFLGNKKEETKTWLITVKNNKQKNINVFLFDQIPVSTLEEIEVIPVNISNGKLNPETGIIKWDFQLKPTEKKDIELKYSVRYPKYRTLIIE
ncbi:MAG: mucoidy inhibitor MuiA family protein [Bacteroidales bacterium]|nr:mucoidy inhibitor MuiA family protein [Bacteroidales bacterium]